MSFDEKFKEGARANDAVDRLREVKVRLKEEQERRERLIGDIFRYAILAIVAGIVVYAVIKL